MTDDFVTTLSRLNTDISKLSDAKRLHMFSDVLDALTDYLSLPHYHVVFLLDAELSPVDDGRVAIEGKRLAVTSNMKPANNRQAVISVVEAILTVMRNEEGEEWVDGKTR